MQMQLHRQISHSEDHHHHHSNSNSNYHQYNNKILRNDSIMYLMRKAVRAVEFKITKIRHIFGSPDWEMVQEEFHTDIPEALWESKSKVYNDWAKDTIVELA